ncbi:MAG TPA: PAS domain S-box protein [Thermoanaerobaculia bacterium]|nr:PAS domain S-box protein [Thermoanaerobaculia bacterium]
MDERLLDTLPIAVIVTTPDGLITFWSGGAERLYGWPAEEVIGRLITDVTVATPVAARALDIMNELRAGRVWSGAFRVRRRNGSDFVALVSDAPTFDDAGTLSAITGISLPLEQFNAAEILGEAESFYRDVVETAQEGIVMTDPDGRIVFVNARFAEMLGFAQHELLGRTPDAVLSKEDGERVRQRLDRRRDGISDQYELCFQRADGTPLWTLVEGRPLHDRDGKFRGTRATIVDVTARKNSELRLAERERQLRQAQKVARIASWELDLHTRVCRLEEGSGLTRSPGPTIAPLDTILELVHPADRAAILEAIAETQLTGNTLNVEYRIRLHDGRQCVIHSRGELVRGEDGTPLRITGVVQNITERKRLEERLQQAERISSIGRLAASVAHEFNNILMGIQPFAELITRGSDNQGVADAAAHIIRGVSRGKRITQDILRFTRTPDPALRTIELSSWLQRIEPELRQLAGPRVTLHAHSDGAAMYADAEQVQQVLSNLVVNAADAMPSGGELFIEAAADGASVHVTVRDTGIGMSREVLGMIFEPLFTTKKAGGNGLGLAIAYQLMKRQNGEILAESEEGRGTTFHLRLPLSLAEPAELPRSIGTPRATKWPFARVTLIEDNEAVAAGIAAMLQYDGVSVDIVTSGREAVARVDDYDPEAVILDVGLPDMSGVDVYRELARRWPDLPILFSTGHGDERLLGDLLDNERIRCLQKPYESETLFAELQKLRDAIGTAAAVRIQRS